MLSDGPTRIPEMAVPQGWEQVPAVGTGMGIQEMIKTTAARSPIKGLKDRSRAALFFRRYKPKTQKGKTAINQKAAQLKGNRPSEICMAKALPVNPKQTHNRTSGEFCLIENVLKIPPSLPLSKGGADSPPFGKGD